MAVKMKVTRNITPKDKSKIKRTISKSVSVRTDGNKILSVSRSKNVKNNKKNKWFFQERN